MTTTDRLTKPQADHLRRLCGAESRMDPAPSSAIATPVAFTDVRRVMATWKDDEGTVRHRIVAVGSRGTLEHLADKGYLQRRPGWSKRSTFTVYRLTDKARDWFAKGAGL